MAGSEPEEVLLEATCRICDLTFDVWAFTQNGQMLVSSLDRLRCPECLVVSDEIKQKESLL